MQFVDDFILREIKKLVQLVASIVNLKQQDQIEEAEREIDTAYGRLLNMDRQLFEILDAQNIAKMLGDPDRIRLVAEVMQAEADLMQTRGEIDRARQRYKRALKLLESCEEEPGCIETRESLAMRIEQFG